MDDVGNTLRWIIGIGLLVGYFWLIKWHGDSSDKIDEVIEQRGRDRAAEQESQAEADYKLIEFAASKAPDYVAAFEILLERFRWADLLNHAHISAVEMELLLLVYLYDGTEEIYLPNLNARRIATGARAAFKAARDAAGESWREEFERHGADFFAQKPTVGTLTSLVARGWVTVNSELTRASEYFICNITNSGLAVRNMIAKYGRASPITQLYVPINSKATVLVSRLVWGTISEEEKKVIAMQAG